MKKVFCCCGIGVLIVTLSIAIYSFFRIENSNIILEFAMFTGGNWDVESANSFTIIDAAIEQFEKENPGVSVHYYSGIAKDDYSEWFTRKLLAGDTPDVFMILGNDFNQFASLGIMKNLESFILNDSEFHKEDYFATAFESGKYGEYQYALPYETVPTLMFVNKTLLNKEGIIVPNESWNYDDLYQICRQVTKDTNADGILDQFGIYNYSWLDAIYANNGELFEIDGSKSYFNDTKVIDAVKFIQQLEDLNNGTKITQEDFNGGNVAFMPLTFAEYRTYKSYPYKIKKFSKFQWDCIAMPAGVEGENTSRVDNLLMGISAKTKKEELAWEFLKILTYNKEIQTMIFTDSQGASVLKSVTDSKKMEEIVGEDMEKNETVISGKLLGNVIENGKIEPKFKKYEQALTIAESEISSILESKKNIDSSLKILQRTINDFLQQ
ncbi:MAG: ABC transporter substrate-binding protein [Lachnospiraceae bacterium]